MDKNQASDPSTTLLLYAVGITLAITFMSLIYPVTAITTAVAYSLFILGLQHAFIATFPGSDPHQLLIWAIWLALIPALAVAGSLFQYEKRFALNRWFWTARHCWRLLACAAWVFFTFGALRGDIAGATYSNALSGMFLAPVNLVSNPVQTPWDILAQLMTGVKLTFAMGANMLHLLIGDLPGLGASGGPHWIIEGGWALGVVVVMHFLLFFAWKRSREDELSVSV